MTKESARGAVGELAAGECEEAAPARETPGRGGERSGEGAEVDTQEGVVTFPSAWQPHHRSGTHQDLIVLLSNCQQNLVANSAG